MAHSRTAKKNVRKNATNRARNRWRIDRVRNALKDFRTTVAAGDVAAAEVKYKAVTKLVDQIASTSSLHKNAASRHKSRMALQINKLKAAKASGQAQA